MPRENPAVGIFTPLLAISFISGSNFPVLGSLNSRTTILFFTSEEKFFVSSSIFHSKTSMTLSPTSLVPIPIFPAESDGISDATFFTAFSNDSP